MSLFETVLDKNRVLKGNNEGDILCFGQNCEYLGGLILEVPNGCLLLCRIHARIVYAEMRKVGIEIPKADWEE